MRRWLYLSVWVTSLLGALLAIAIGVRSFIAIDSLVFDISANGSTTMRAVGLAEARGWLFCGWASYTGNIPSRASVRDRAEFQRAAISQDQYLQMRGTFEQALRGWRLGTYASLRPLGVQGILLRVPIAAISAAL